MRSRVRYIKEPTTFPAALGRCPNPLMDPLTYKPASAGLKPLPVTETSVPDGPTFGFSETWADGVPTVKIA